MENLQSSTITEDLSVTSEHNHSSDQAIEKIMRICKNELVFAAPQYVVYIYGESGCGKSAFISKLMDRPSNKTSPIAHGPSYVDEDYWFMKRRYKFIEIRDECVLKAVPRPHFLVILYSTRLTLPIVNLVNWAGSLEWNFLLVRNKFDIDCQDGKVMKHVESLRQVYQSAAFIMTPPLYVSCSLNRDVFDIDDFSTIKRLTLFQSI